MEFAEKILTRIGVGQDERKVLKHFVCFMVSPMFHKYLKGKNKRSSPLNGLYETVIEFEGVIK